MDARQCMIVDLEKHGDKRMFITEQVSSINMNTKEQWTVRFKSSPRPFNYNPHRLLYLTDPVSICLEGKGLYVRNKHITGVAELFRFANSRYTFYHVIHTDGYHENLCANDVYITRTPIAISGGSNWEYLKKLAAETGLTTEEDENILSRQYDLIDVKRDNVPLAQYLGDKRKLRTYRLPTTTYYPFGCNASQKAAVEAALTHQVSIIQGPPGTGKTQTILNIIANLLIMGKTVLVVSNNNSAVENVAEKLSKENLGFLVAQLGSLENRKNFIGDQPEYPDMSAWHIEEPAAIEELAKSALVSVSLGFGVQKQKALLKAEYDALMTEAKYNGMLPQNKDRNNWLMGWHSSKLMSLLSRYRILTEKDRKPGIWFRLKWAIALNPRVFSFLANKPSEVIAAFETAYYSSRKTEMEHKLKIIEDALQQADITQNMERLRSSSLQLLKNRLADKYTKGKRKKFTVGEMKSRSEEFLMEYPIVLSTTYSAKNCISGDVVFDYVIMDEASQVDIKTGALSLSCALNAVIVGDDKQLPNVVTKEEALALDAIRMSYNVEDKYNAVTHSFLQSCAEVFKEAPVTLLREHYRCHPKIIGFCNRHFYDGELIAMTTDKDEKDVLQVIRTVPGNHARGHINQREIETIVQEVMPEYANSGSIGIITPYRTQAAALNKALDKDISSTVHKYQGRECDAIIMSMVDNTPTAFSDDANLLNVAISRAVSRLCVVVNGNDIPEDSNIGQLISYIRYNNFEVRESRLHSVFDLLYKQYTAERLAYEATHRHVSSHLSENLMYDVLIKAIEKLSMTNTEVLCHYPLSKLIADWNCLDASETTFAESPYSHVDFLVYNSLTKKPNFAIEVDGWHNHKESDVQRQRDALKDSIFTKLGLCLYRISTTDIVNVEAMTDLILRNRL